VNQTQKNLFWFIAVAVLLMFHGCVGLQWMEEADEADRFKEVPAERY
jgi:hypothetical protein